MNQKGLLVGGGIVLGILVAALVLIMSNGENGRENVVMSSAPQALEAIAEFGEVPPDATFMERSGKEITLGDLQGSVWVASFIFTRCQGTCPMMSSALRELQSELTKSGDVKLVSFTVDPEYDTPERLQEYARKLNADADNWLFLTGGGDSAVQKLALETFHLGIGEGKDTLEPIVHSSRFVVVDQEGTIRGYFDGISKEAQKELLKTVDILVSDRKKLTAGAEERTDAF